MTIDWTKYNEFFPDRYLRKSNIDTQIEEIFSNLKSPKKFFDLTFDLDIGEKITALDIGGNEGTEQLKMADEAYFLDPFVPKPEWYKKQLTWEDIFIGNYKFNLIVAKNSINYLDKEQLKILPKLLKPGGIFIANTFVKPSEINREFTNSRSGKKGVERSEYRDGKIFHYLDVDGITIEHWFYYYSAEDYSELFKMINNPEIIYASFTSFQDAPNSIIIKIKTK